MIDGRASPLLGYGIGTWLLHLNGLVTTVKGLCPGDHLIEIKSNTLTIKTVKRGQGQTYKVMGALSSTRLLEKGQGGTITPPIFDLAQIPILTDKPIVSVGSNHHLSLDYAVGAFVGRGGSTLKLRNKVFSGCGGAAKQKLGAVNIDKVAYDPINPLLEV